MQVASSAGGCNDYLSVHTPTLNILYPTIDKVVVSIKGSVGLELFDIVANNNIA